MTKAQQEYKKQVQRVKNAIRRLEKEGYIVEADIIPAKPQRITKKALQQIQEITPKRIRNLSTRIDLETGEVLEEAGTKKQTRKKGTTVAPKKSEAKPKKSKTKDTIAKPKKSKVKSKTKDETTDTNYPTLDIIEEIKKKIDNLPNERRVRGRDGKWKYVDISDVKDTLIGYLYDNIAEYGEDNVREYYTARQTELFEAFNNITYSSDEDILITIINRVADILSMQGVSFNDNANFTDYTEYYNYGE